jgi:hypothetical protein
VTVIGWSASRIITPAPDENWALVPPYAPPNVTWNDAIDDL